jgi:alkylated DNA repair dioxygenase AlkB
MPPRHRLGNAVAMLQQGRTVLEGADLEYIPGFLSPGDADDLLATLLAIVPWQQPVVQLFGRTFRSPRLAAWYGDAGAVYQYSGLVNEPLPWLFSLAVLRRRIEQQFREHLNSVLLNCYRDGADSMGWHRDREPELGENPAIASISLGGVRRFVLQHSRQTDMTRLELCPEHGSLLLMRGATQHFWRHCVPKTRKVVAPRVNLTFRQIVFPVAVPEIEQEPIVASS